MASTATLLQMAPADALLRMINDANNTSFPPGSLLPGSPTAVNATSTQVRMTARPLASPIDDSPYTGEVDITFNRLDLGAHFAAALDGYTVTLPSSTQVILDELTQRLGQAFFEEDIILEEITRNNAINYRIKAKSESLRWTGYLEVTVANLIDLSTYLDGGLPAGTPRLGTMAQDRVRFNPNDSLPFINGTPARGLIETFTVGETANANPIIPIVLNRIVPPPSHLLSDNLSPWSIAAGPADFNLDQATVASVRDLSGVSEINLRLDKVLEISLDPTQCTNFLAGPLQIPFLSATYPETQFTVPPRLTSVGIVSMTDASLYNEYLNNTFHKGDIITSIDVGEPFEIEPGVVWLADANNPGPTNLYNAVVQYNGQKRTTDVAPAHNDLDRIMVVTLSDSNTAYRGNFSIYYRSPIQMDLSIPNATIGSNYDYQFAPEGGVGPYTYAVTGGALEASQTIDSSGHFSGTPTVAGTYTFELTVTDSNGLAVVFNYTYVVNAQIQTLALSGSFVNGTVGSTYVSFMNVAGGKQPYSNARATSGQLPDGLLLTVISSSVRLSGTPTRAGTFTFTVAVDSNDGQTAARSVTVIIS